MSVVFRSSAATFKRPPDMEDLDQNDRFLTKEQLRQRLNLPSTRKIDYMMKLRMIPFLKWGSKTVRFEWDKVAAALAKFEYKAVG